MIASTTRRQAGDTTSNDAIARWIIMLAMSFEPSNGYMNIAARYNTIIKTHQN